MKETQTRPLLQEKVAESMIIIIIIILKSRYDPPSRIREAVLMEKQRKKQVMMYNGKPQLCRPLQRRPRDKPSLHMHLSFSVFINPEHCQRSRKWPHSSFLWLLIRDRKYDHLMNITVNLEKCSQMHPQHTF